MSELPVDRDRARSLRRRLNDHAVDIALLAAEAAVVFADAGSATHVRWLELELQGYGSLGSVSSLHEALGVPPDDRLVVHVFAYRSQPGQIVEGTEGTGRPFRHFFVEALGDIVAAAERAKRGELGGLRLDFGRPDLPNYPGAGVFPSGVFERVLLGFRAALHLQLGSIAS